MTKLNTRSRVSHPQLMQSKTPPNKLNREGELAWDLPPIEKLMNITSTLLFGEKKFYDSASKPPSYRGWPFGRRELGLEEHQPADTLNEFYTAIDAVMKIDPIFVLQLAAYARNELYLRTTPQVLLARAVMSKNAPKTKAWEEAVRTWGPNIMRRADEPLSLASYIIKEYWQPVKANVQGIARTHGRLPKHLRHAIESRLATLTEYDVVKYYNTSAMKGRTIKARDLLRLVHPRCEEKTDLFRYVLGRPSIQDVERKGNDILNYVDPKTSETKNHGIEYCYDENKLPFILAMQRFNELPSAEYNQEAIDLITKYRIPWNFASSKFGKQKWMWNALAPKMPIMALLMNLRNILEAGADITPVVKQLTTEEKIQHSKLFPFRFLTAYRAVNGNHSTGMPRNFTTIKEKNADPFNVKKVANALKTAMQLALNNMPTFTGRTLIAADNSSSMDKAISDKSEVHLKDIADTFAAMANHIFEDAIVSTFAERFRIVTTSDDKDILENAEKIRGTNVGGSTNGYKVFEYLLTGKEENDDPYQLARRLVSPYNTRHDFTSKTVTRNPIPVDRIVIFTDQELWDTKFTTHVFEKYKEYVKAIGKEPFVYLVDVGGYGETCFPPGLPNVCMISGWSENLFKFIDQFEKGIGTQVSHVKGLQPGTEMHRDEPEVEQSE